MDALQQYTLLHERVRTVVGEDRDMVPAVVDRIWSAWLARAPLDETPLEKFCEAFLDPEDVGFGSTNSPATATFPVTNPHLLAAAMAAEPDPSALAATTLFTPTPALPWIGPRELLDETIAISCGGVSAPEQKTPRDRIYWQWLISAALHAALLLLMVQAPPAESRDEISLQVSYTMTRPIAPLQDAPPRLETSDSAPEPADAAPEETTSNVTETTPSEWEEITKNVPLDEFEIAITSPEEPLLTGRLQVDLGDSKDTYHDDAGELPVDTDGAWGDWLRGRGKYGKNRATENGGDVATYLAVQDALDWLARHQDPQTGAWHWWGYGRQCKEFHCEKNVANAQPNAMYDMAATGFALLALQAGGHSLHQGKYAEPVAKGLKYLLQQQRNGIFCENMYAHAIAATAVAEAYGMTCNEQCRQAAEEALGVLYLSQHKDGGWRYETLPYQSTVEKGRESTRPSSVSDLSVTGWVALAIKVGDQLQLLPGHERVYHDFDIYLKHTETGSDYQAGYTNGNNPTPRLTAVAMMAHTMWQEESQLSRARVQMNYVINGFTYKSNLSDAQESSLLEALYHWRQLRSDTTLNNPKHTEKCDELLEKIVKLRQPLGNGDTLPFDLYHLYYAQLGMFQLAGDAWDAWNSRVKTALLVNQYVAECERGAWDMDGTFNSRVVSTALCALILEVYNRYPRLSDR